MSSHLSYGNTCQICYVIAFGVFYACVRSWIKWSYNCIMSRHYVDVIMTMLASQITSLTVVYSIVYSGVNQRKHQSPESLAFVREIHRGPVNFPHKWPVTRKMFPFDDVIMTSESPRPAYVINMVLVETCAMLTPFRCCHWNHIIAFVPLCSN